ncbi:MAG: hypothetical protein IPI33_08820 [Dehalococcoidia bacterium]|uniref:hypothetical protein n=1 Tax=Candidatus Amarobacter glycogenicus TaxID=3140699 RepID=UPI001D4FD400|nr:hypothetical protein [Dehalococcoidia bacterium]MBK7126684.1 hypothetical protein [Dehalococcoidia bacterium]MBK7329617.1 hypothetical protein [Dehalococcoidia bacterium]MBK7725322.1 hypothetical protein [Dehalococcoidia bacterium]MBK8561619.1 hypothetical protein [Dehalococcoidia bacterium]
MTQPGIADLMDQWKLMSDQFLKSWGESYEAYSGSEQGQTLAGEMEKNYVAARATMAKAARDAYGPIVEAVGAVPLTEFQRLADQVHTVLLRLDKIDDALAALLGGQAPAPVRAPAAAAKKKAVKKK